MRQFTQARIALGRTGSSLPTEEVLQFGYAHAMAQDAVHLPLDVDALCASLHAADFPTLRVNSRAGDRGTYLLRPDLGRRLEAESVAALQAAKPEKPLDLLLVVGDGLSSLAIQKHALPMLEAIRRIAPQDWQIGPVVVASQARVALGDEVGEALGARLVAILIGERPGLSSPDSLGMYLTYEPRVGRHNAERNCISNVRTEGLSYATAAHKLLWLAQEGLRLKLTGVDLKDESDMILIAPPAEIKQLP